MNKIESITTKNSSLLDSNSSIVGKKDKKGIMIKFFISSGFLSDKNSLEKFAYSQRNELFKTKVILLKKSISISFNKKTITIAIKLENKRK